MEEAQDSEARGSEWDKGSSWGRDGGGERLRQGPGGRGRLSGQFPFLKALGNPGEVALLFCSPCTPIQPIAQI